MTRNPSDVLREKIEEYKQVLKEIDALRIVIPILAEPVSEPEKATAINDLVR